MRRCMIVLVLTLLLTSCASSLLNEYQPTAQEIELCKKLFNIDIPTVVYFDSKDYAGMYYPETDRINLNSILSGDYKTAILMHECCHAYQIKVLKRSVNYPKLEYEAYLVQSFVIQYLQGTINQSDLKYMRENMGIIFQ